MNNVFAKVFSQIFDSTIAEDYKVRHVFMDLLVMADSDGVVDKTPQAISRIANVPIEQVEAGIEALASPDPASRTKENDGRRIELIDSTRDWGWRIINFQKYREIRDEEARRIANRSYKRDQRKRQQASASSSDIPKKSAQVEGEVDLGKATKPLKVNKHRLPEDFIPKKEHYELAKTIGVIVDMEFPKFRDHFLGNGDAKVDWNRALNNWLRRSLEYGGRHGTHQQSGGKVQRESRARQVARTNLESAAALGWITPLDSPEQVEGDATGRDEAVAGKVGRILDGNH